MGTRCLTYVYEGNSPLICLYRQFDGYPSGHGAELGDFLKGIQLGNGIAGKPEMGTFANGMGCLAAQLVAHFKQSVGGFYIYSVTSTDCWQDYEYHVYENKVIVNSCATVYDSGHSQVIFEGTWEELNEFCSESV